MTIFICTIDKYMRTLIILLLLVIGIVTVVFLVFFKEDSQNIFNFLRKEKKHTETHHSIDTKYFQEGLGLLEFHHKELKQLKESLHTHII